jgi:ubiquitin C-terminal hydrolase
MPYILPEPQNKNEAWNMYKTYNENSPLVDIFVGQTKTTIRCHVCNNERFKWDPFWGFSLSIPELERKKSLNLFSKKRCTLNDCLREFYRPEVLAGNSNIMCYICQNNMESTNTNMESKR